VIRALASEEIERVLRAEVVGRIGCHANGRTYVVPVCYAYDAGAIYAHSGLGLKIEMMRQNPLVCFEVDHVEDLANWDSAICWGRYEELSRADAEHGLELIRARIRERMPRDLGHGRLAGEAADGHEVPILFRLNLTELTGREERLYWELLPIARNGSVRPADRWLTHERAQQLADMASVLDAEAIWEAADKLVEGHASEEVAASLTYQGAPDDVARSIVGFLVELEEAAESASHAPARVSSS
jgi:uncharacterized protein